MSYAATNNNGTAKIRSMEILGFSQRKLSGLSNRLWPWNSALPFAEWEFRPLHEEQHNEEVSCKAEHPALYAGLTLSSIPYKLTTSYSAVWWPCSCQLMFKSSISALLINCTKTSDSPFCSSWWTFKSILAFSVNVLSQKFLLTYLKIGNEAKHGWVLLKSKFARHACISNATITNKIWGADIEALPYGSCHSLLDNELTF